MVQPVLRLFFVSLCLVLLASTAVNGRYLPTRSNEDSLDKLRDLLRDILEVDKPNTHPGSIHLGGFYGNDGAEQRYPYAGQKFLRKREINGWEVYDPLGQPLQLH